MQNNKKLNIILKLAILKFWNVNISRCQLEPCSSKMMMMMSCYSNWIDSSGSLIKCWSKFSIKQNQLRLVLALTWQFQPSWVMNFFRVTHFLHLASGWRLSSRPIRQERVIDKTGKSDEEDESLWSTLSFMTDNWQVSVKTNLGPVWKKTYFSTLFLFQKKQIAWPAQQEVQETKQSLTLYEN